MCLVHVEHCVYKSWLEALATGPPEGKGVLPMRPSIMAKIASPPRPAAESAPEDLDDYMSMTIVEPAKPAEKETSSQRRLRKQREVRLPHPQPLFSPPLFPSTLFLPRPPLLLAGVTTKATSASPGGSKIAPQIQSRTRRRRRRRPRRCPRDRAPQYLQGLPDDGQARLQARRRPGRYVEPERPDRAAGDQRQGGQGRGGDAE